jgi:hypothetical protein
MLLPQLPSVNTLRAQLIFLFKPNFCNLFKFSGTKFTQKQNLSHFSFENCKIDY